MKNYWFVPFLLALFVGVNLHAEETRPLVYQINIKENIGSNTWIYLKNGMHEANESGASAILLHMNTYGGAVLEADSMRTAILNSPIPVYVFVDNNAASAGALVSIACDSIFMRESASIGAATVVDGGTGEQAPDKYQSYMRATMRATAESHGKEVIVQNGDTIERWRRDPLIAEAMVDERVVIPGYVDSTQVLTLTASQAMDLRYCEGIAESVHEVIVTHLKYDDYRLETYNPSFYDKIKGFLTNGVVQAFLIMFIIGGIYFELQSPGVGFPTAVAITAALLYFTPLYLTGYAESWEVLIFVLWPYLYRLRDICDPWLRGGRYHGDRVDGGGLVLAAIGNIRFNFGVIPFREVFKASMTVLGGLGLGIIGIIYMSSRIGKRGFLRKVALSADQEGFISVPMEPASWWAAWGWRRPT